MSYSFSILRWILTSESVHVTNQIASEYNATDTLLLAVIWRLSFERLKPKLILCCQCTWKSTNAQHQNGDQVRFTHTQCKMVHPWALLITWLRKRSCLSNSYVRGTTALPTHRVQVHAFTENVAHVIPSGQHHVVSTFISVGQVMDNRMLASSRSNANRVSGRYLQVSMHSCMRNANLFLYVTLNASNRLQIIRHCGAKLQLMNFFYGNSILLIAECRILYWIKLSSQWRQ